MLDLPLPAIFGQCIPLSFQTVPLCCESVALRIELGQLSVDLLLLLVCSPLNLLMLDLPLPALFGQCVPLGFQTVSLVC